VILISINSGTFVSGEVPLRMIVSPVIFRYNIVVCDGK